MTASRKVLANAAGGIVVVQLVALLTGLAGPLFESGQRTCEDFFHLSK